MKAAPSWGEPREGEQRSSPEEEGEDELLKSRKKDECADELRVLLLCGEKYHCAEWEHMGITVRCQQAYWHHTETQAVIKSHLICSRSIFCLSVPFFISVCNHVSIHSMKSVSIWKDNVIILKKYSICSDVTPLLVSLLQHFFFFFRNVKYMSRC